MAWAFRLTHRIVRPVHTLHRALDALVAGELGVRVALQRGMSFREVARPSTAWWTNLRPRWARCTRWSIARRRGARGVLPVDPRAAPGLVRSSIGRWSSSAPNHGGRSVRTTAEMRRALVLACLLPVAAQAAPPSSIRIPTTDLVPERQVTLQLPERQHRGERPLFALSPTRARAAERVRAAVNLEAGLDVAPSDHPTTTGRS